MAREKGPSQLPSKGSKGDMIFVCQLHLRGTRAGRRWEGGKVSPRKRCRNPTD